MKIVVVDSGVCREHKALKGETFSGYGLKYDGEKVNRLEDFSDEYGHGTAVYQIIRKRCPGVDIKVIKIFDKELTISEEAFFEILKYIYEHEDADIINLSLGITLCSNGEKLYSLCERMSEKGTVLVSAFDNAGAISYPAAFDCVIGVDAANYITSDDKYEYVESSIVNMKTKGGISRLAWINPDYILTGGTSFACAYATAIIANQMLNGKLDLKGNATYENLQGENEALHEDKLSFEIKRAAIFPFNKEMHSVIRFSNLLDFEIDAVYDVKFSGRVGVSTKKVLNDSSVPDYTIRDIEDIQWNQIDTLILGHLDELTVLVKDSKMRENLVRKAVENGVNIYSFDPLIVRGYPNVYYPHIEKGDVPRNFGKMYRIGTPVVGVFGTSSRQGKFTLQLTLRDNLKKLGYKVGQLGTEPSAFLYGMDEVFAFGYNKMIHVNESEAIVLLNDKMRKIAEKDHEIIIVGSQSGTVPYDFANLSLFPMDQIGFLYGTAPDAVILAVNPHDDMDYVGRTVNFIESAIGCKVIGLCLFPMKLQDGYAGLIGSKVKLTDEEIEQHKQSLTSNIQRPVFALGCEKDMDMLTNTVIDFFGGSDEEE